jgi:fumarate reductase flavoprotein subunit
MIFDDSVARKFSDWPYPVSTFPGVAYAYVQDYKRYRPDVYFAAPTIESLAEKIGADPAVLHRTTESWNEAVEAHHDTDFGRTQFGMGVRRGPFYALGPLGAFVTLADGGLSVDTQLRVVSEDGVAVPGLWAAGSTGQGGLQLVNHGLHIGWAMVSGRIAGRQVAQAQNRSDLNAVDDQGSVLSSSLPASNTPDALSRQND